MSNMINHTTLTNWQIKHFNQLSVEELYSVIKLRVNVFINEQTCFYPELDDFDTHPNTLHVFTYGISNTNNTSREVIAYARILPVNTRYKEAVSIGRVVVEKLMRKQGLGHQLVNQALITCKNHFKNTTIKISAQTQLEHFYQQHLFTRITENYLEDNIPHLTMQYNMNIK